jgi:hypothetical protein
MDVWQNAMQKNNEQQIEDIIKLAKHKPKTKQKKGKDRSNIQTNVLANTMLAQNTNKPKVTPTSDSERDGSQQIDIDFQMKAMQEHLKKQPNLIDMYEKANTKVASTTFTDKLDNRAALKLTTKPDQWTYQLLVETSPIARMIDTIVQQFRFNEYSSNNYL